MTHTLVVGSFEASQVLRRLAVMHRYNFTLARPSGDHWLVAVECTEQQAECLLRMVAMGERN